MLNQNYTHKIIPYFLPSKGCPFSCIYCDQHIISQTEESSPAERAAAFFSKYDEKGKNVEFGYFGGTFTGLSFHEQAYFLESISSYIKNGFICGIRCSTRPDMIKAEFFNMYHEKKLIHFELGVQSFNNKYLRFLQRGYREEIVMQSINTLKKSNFRFGIQLMCGFPSQKRHEFIDEVKKIVDLGSTDCRIYPLAVIKGTRLERVFLKKDFISVAFDELVDWISDAIDILRQANVAIRRIGLPHSQQLHEKICGGFYHPSFADIVWKKKLLASLEKIHSDCPEIAVSKKDYSYAYSFIKNSSRKKTIVSVDEHIERGAVMVIP